MASLIPKNQHDREYMLLGLRIAGDFGATIAVPLVVFVMIGQWLDHRYNVSPSATIAAFALSALASGRMIYKKAKTYGKLYENLEKKNIQKKDE